MHYKLTFATVNHDILIALLSDAYPFEAFEEREDHLDAWLPTREYSPSLAAALNREFAHLYHEFRAVEVADANWNAQWESSFEPVRVRDFCMVRASFHPVPNDVQHDLVIDPKMAFGTGHHATTWLMIDAMAKLNFHGKSVLDLGCGTGVLAILAAKMEAGGVLAIDNDPKAIENTAENTAVNNVSLEMKEGSLDAAGEASFDYILANINRNVLLNLMPRFPEYLADAGIVIMSGILIGDVPMIKDSASIHGLECTTRTEKGEWACLVLERA